MHLNLFDPLNQEELEGLLVRLWEDGSVAVAQAMHNRKNIDLYSWDSSAMQYLQLFERALEAKR